MSWNRRGRHAKKGSVRLMISSATGRIAMAAVFVLALALALGLFLPGRASSKAPAPHSDSVVNAPLPPLGSRVAPKAPVLPPATVPPAPAPASVAAADPLAPHEVFGFAPYWSLDQSAGFNVAGLTTLAYFSVGINADGSLNESGPGWNGYESQALSTLITRAHAAGKRVVLTVNDFDQHSLDALTSNPAAATTLSKALVGAIGAKSLDGVNLDLEGAGSADQAGLTALVTTVSDALHFINPHWQVTMDTYASSAGDPGGFYDIPALAGVVDAFFVMEYSPNVAAPAQAASPLTSALFSDLSTAAQYAAAVPAGKVILGTPLFGIDWPTTGNTLTDTATGPATTQPDFQITGSGHPLYWDPVTDTAWTAYQVGSQWHETFFDDPTSLYQIAHLAAQDGLRGVGVWALGMEGTDPAMVSALDGVAPAIAYATPAPPSTTTTSAPPPAATAPTTTACRVEPPVKVARARPGGLRSLSPRRPSSGRSRPSPWSPSKTALRRRLPLHLPRRASRCVWWRHPPCPAQAARHPFPWPVPRPRPLRGSARRFRERSWSACYAGWWCRTIRPSAVSKMPTSQTSSAHRRPSRRHQSWWSGNGPATSSTSTSSPRRPPAQLRPIAPAPRWHFPNLPRRRLPGWPHRKSGRPSHSLPRPGL